MVLSISVKLEVVGYDVPVGGRLYLIGILKSCLQPDDEVPLELCEKVWYQKGHVDPEVKTWTSEFQIDAY